MPTCPNCGSDAAERYTPHALSCTRCGEDYRADDAFMHPSRLAVVEAAIRRELLRHQQIGLLRFMPREQTIEDCAAAAIAAISADH